MSLFSDFFSPERIEATRLRIVGWLKAAGLDTTAFEEGDPEQQIEEAMTASANNSSQLVSQLVRGRASLDTATDPGDPDPYDATNEALEPRAGYLSEYGAGQFGTERIDRTFATGIVTIDNTGGSSPAYISPETVTFAKTANPAITYRNEADDTVYTNPDGTATIPAFGTLDVTIVCETVGTDGNAGAGGIELVTTIGSGITASNSAAVLASSREDPDAYRARCRTAAAILSLQGPADAYRVICLGAQKDADGNIFFFPPWGDGVTAIGVTSAGVFALFPNARGTSLGINRVYVDEDNTDGTVDVWIADASGDPGASVLTDITLLLDNVYLPQCNTVEYHRVVNVPVTIAGTVKAKSGSGVTTSVIATAIDDAINAAFPLYEIGGYDQTAGAGTLYKQELESLVNGAHAKVYKVTLSSPVGDTALAKGRVAVATNNITSGDVTIT